MKQKILGEKERDPRLGVVHFDEKEEQGGGREWGIGGEEGKREFEVEIAGSAEKGNGNGDEQRKRGKKKVE